MLWWELGMSTPQPPGGKEPRISGSLSTLRLFGVPVRFHFTFIFLLLFLIMLGAEGRSSLRSVLYVVALFGSVILHEMGHALVSRHYGIRTYEIVLFPIGGVARMERTPKPREELWIALAGPAVNVAVGAVLMAAAWFTHSALDWRTLMSTSEHSLLLQIGAGNLLLAAFNLLPAFPMDGGRILRAFLALSRPEDQATRIAARSGRFLAIIMGLYGLLQANYLLLFVAFFVYLGAVQESAAAIGRAMTHGMPVRAAMVSEYHTLSHGQTIRDAANLLLATSQQDFPIVHGDQVLGLLTRSALLRAMARDGPEGYIASAMDRTYLSLPPTMDLSEALPLMSQPGTCALVMEGERLIGLLTSENLSEFVLLRQFETKGTA
jgi:Zn-dependent protease/CBS domain-containing protein